MSILDQLAISLGRRDEKPNEELAIQIVKREDEKAVCELIALLHQKDRNVQSDSIKVVYEVANRRPSMIVKYLPELLVLLDSKNNRMQWGAMTAIDAITMESPEKVYDALPRILSVAGQGSVITRDHAVGILIKLAGSKTFREEAFALLLEQLGSCPVNQLPMYAENALPVVGEKQTTVFIQVLQSRLGETEKESQRKRVEKLIRKMGRQGK